MMVVVWHLLVGVEQTQVFTLALVAERHVHMMRFLLLLQRESLVVLGLPESYRVDLHGRVPHYGVLDSRLARAPFLPIIIIIDIEAESSALKQGRVAPLL